MHGIKVPNFIKISITLSKLILKKYIFLQLYHTFSQNLSRLGQTFISIFFLKMCPRMSSVNNSMLLRKTLHRFKRLHFFRYIKSLLNLNTRAFQK